MNSKLTSFSLGLFAVYCLAALGCGATQQGSIGDTSEPNGAPTDGGSIDVIEPPSDASPDAPVEVPRTDVKPNCFEVAATCGATGDEDCCTALEVPGGTFSLNYDGISDNARDPSHKATLSPFVLDKFEVTVSRFRAFVEGGFGTRIHPPAVGAGAHPKRPESGWSASDTKELAAGISELRGLLQCDPDFATWTNAPGPNESRPVNCVTWYEAFAFCAWDGGRLPTYAELNFAAAGGDEQRVYPWSSPPQTDVISREYASYGCWRAGERCALSDVLVVGSKPLGNGRWGHADLAGNLWEYVLDRGIGASTPCDDCVDMEKADYPLMRGGAYQSEGALLRAAKPGATTWGARTSIQGFRCARDVMP